MSSTAWATILVLSVFLGFEVIAKVSAILHTPLMSGANAIHGVVLVGAILAAGTADDTAELVLGLLAVVLATVNMVGGFVVTDRMLGMFARPRPAPAPTSQDSPSAGAQGGGTSQEPK
jgi:H+-translocating NAD(P) transhydrogenase subunit alpha